jgi:NDP-sugar pyrophosphorylase family protein
MFRPADLFDLAQTDHRVLFNGCEFAWDALKRLKEYIEAQTREAPAHSLAAVGPHVLVGEGTVIEPGARIRGPAIIGKHCQIRHGAYIREHVIVGDGCVIGNACELKHAVLFNDCQVPHFNYVGDSILGHKAHLGAGVILSNVKSLPGTVVVEAAGRRMDTGLRKFGALLGDRAEIGCNSVLNPGSIIGCGALVYPLTNWRGALAPNQIAKNRSVVEVVPRRLRSG